MAIQGLPDHVNEKLAEEGITTPQAALDADLTAIHGIGPATAGEIRAAAEAALAEEVQAAQAPDADDDEADAPAPAEEPAADPDGEPPEEPAPAWVEVKLVGAATSNIGGYAIWEGDTRRVRYDQYRRAAEANPGAFHVRRVGEREYREAL